MPRSYRPRFPCIQPGCRCAAAGPNRYCKVHLVKATSGGHVSAAPGQPYVSEMFTPLSAGERAALDRVREEIVEAFFADAPAPSAHQEARVILDHHRIRPDRRTKDGGAP